MSKPEYLELFAKKLSFPTDAAMTLLSSYEKLLSDPIAAELVDSACEHYFRPIDQKPTCEMLERVSSQTGIHIYTVHFLFLIHASERLRALYAEKGLSDELFWAIMLDLRCKLIECHDVYGIWGTFVFGWFHRHYLVDRFALGRFQYESATFDRADYTCGDITLKNGDRVYGFHIPSSGSIPWEARLDSYMRAFDFFGGAEKGYIALVCDSWLLYPKYRSVFPEGSNIASFVRDFDVIDHGESERFDDSWRVFGMPCDSPISSLPRDTRLRRAFADHMMSNEKSFGWGFGVIIFDGKSIINGSR